MISFLSDFVDAVLGNIIGGSTSQSITLGTLILMIIIVVVLLTARLDFTAAVAIVSPGVIIAAFHGALPPVSFGVIVLILGLAWAAIILALIK